MLRPQRGCTHHGHPSSEPCGAVRPRRRPDRRTSTAGRSGSTSSPSSRVPRSCAHRHPTTTTTSASSRSVTEPNRPMPAAGPSGCTTSPGRSTRSANSPSSASTLRDRRRPRRREQSRHDEEPLRPGPRRARTRDRLAAAGRPDRARRPRSQGDRRPARPRRRTRPLRRRRPQRPRRVTTRHGVNPLRGGHT